MFPETKAEAIPTLQDEENLKNEAKNVTSFLLPTALKIPDADSEISEGGLLALAREKQLKEVERSCEFQLAYCDAEKRDTSRKLSIEETMSFGCLSSNYSTIHEISPQRSFSVWKILRRILSKTCSVILNTQKSSNIGRSRERREQSMQTVPTLISDLSSPPSPPPLRTPRNLLNKNFVPIERIPTTECPKIRVPNFVPTLGHTRNLEKQTRPSSRSNAFGRTIRDCKPAGALPSTKAKGSNCRTRDALEKELVVIEGAIEAAEELATRLAVLKTQEEVNLCLADLRAELYTDFKETFKEWLEHRLKHTRRNLASSSSDFQAGKLRRTSSEDNEQGDDPTQIPQTKGLKNYGDEAEGSSSLTRESDTSKIDRFVVHKVSLEVAENYAQRFEAAETIFDLRRQIIELWNELTSSYQGGFKQWLRQEQRISKIDTDIDFRSEKKLHNRPVEEAEKQEPAGYFSLPRRVRRATKFDTVPLASSNLQSPQTVEEAILGLGGSKKTADYWAEVLRETTTKEQLNQCLADLYQELWPEFRGTQEQWNMHEQAIRELIASESNARSLQKRNSTTDSCRLSICYV